MIPPYHNASLFSGIFYNWAELETDSHFYVKCSNTGQIWNIKDRPADLRIKFALLATIGNIKTIMQVFFRVIHIAGGNFIQYAHLQAKHDWVNSLDCDKDNAPILYKKRFYKAVPVEFLKEVGKTLLMTIAIVPTILISLFGLVFPYDARKFMADLEMAYAPTRFSHFAAATPCMADQSYRDRETLHTHNKMKKSWGFHRENTQKARILHSYKGYFEKKNVDLDLPYWKLREIINGAKNPLRASKN